MDMGFSEQVIVPRASLDSDRYIAYNDSNGFVGLKRLPFTTVFQNDICPKAKRMAEWNGWAHQYVVRDIRELIAEQYPFPAADVVIGGFPCQDFSQAGSRGGLSTERGTLYQSFVEVVRRVQPILFVAENVKGLLTLKDNPIKQIVRDFSQVGYEVHYQLVKCEDYGIPQTRHRVIIMGLRNEYRAGAQWNQLTENKIACTVRSYLHHLGEPDVSDDLAQQSYSKAKRLDKGQGQTEVLLDGFSPTIRSNHHGNIEFRRVQQGKNNEPELTERRLTVRECALLQTFPPQCILTNKVSSIGYVPIGNAVPPLLSYLIAQTVYNILSTLS